MSATLVVEDGTGLENANSYVTVAEADDYWELRNDATWAALDDEDKTAAVVRATQYLDYSYRWVGDRYSTLQSLSWPRAVFFDRDARAMFANVIPQRIKDAVCELAKEAATNGLGQPLARGGGVQSETVGPLSISYFPNATPETTFPIVERLLADLIVGELGGGSLTTSAALS